MLQSSRKFSVDLNGIPTDFVFNTYSNRHFVIITQNGKIGTLIHAVPNYEQTPFAKKEIMYSTNVLLGRRDRPVLSIFASEVARCVNASKDRPLLLGICLTSKQEDDGGAATFAQLKQILSTYQQK